MSQDPKEDRLQASRILSNFDLDIRCQSPRYRTGTPHKADRVVREQLREIANQIQSLANRVRHEGEEIGLIPSRELDIFDGLTKSYLLVLERGTAAMLLVECCERCRVCLQDSDQLVVT
jgi:hypothetical protein